jgi:hypothetical protein
MEKINYYQMMEQLKIVAIQLAKHLGKNKNVF